MSENDINKGYTCSHCGQYVKQYRRKLNVSMALVIILMAKANRRSYWHIENWLKEIGRPELRADYHKLRFWNLIEAKQDTRQDGSKRNGFYKLTGRGILFSECKLTVPETAVILNNELQRLEGPEINIKDALRNKFHFDTLMGNFSPQTDKEKQELKQLSLL